MSAGSKNAMVAFDCGSRSMRSVFFFLRAIAAARLMDVVVFPTPPFWLAIARTQVKPLPLRPVVQPRANEWCPGFLAPPRVGPMYLVCADKGKGNLNIAKCGALRLARKSNDPHRNTVGITKG